MRIAIFHDFFDSIGGGEKVVVGIEQLAFNKIYVFPPGQNGLEDEVRCYSERYDKQTTIK